MAFTVEDGTCLAGATSYASVAFADGYATDRGLDTWMALNTTQKERALVLASDYIDKNFRFIGIKRTAAQALQWPRWEAWDDDGWALPLLPPNLLKATVEYAVRSAVAELQPDPTVNTVGGWVKEVEERIGTIKELTKYEGGGELRKMLPYPAADALLSKLILRSGMRLERA